MTQLTCSGLLFDMDGVLISSTPAVTRVWRRWATKHGFDPDEVVAHAHGRPSISTIREYLPNADHDAENREVERQEIEDLDGVVPLPGALQLLSTIPGDRWAIVTSCTRDLAEVRIRAAGLPLPSVFLTASDITHGKPHPEPYLKAASRLRFPPTECVVVEDVPAGIRSGKYAQMRVIALRTTVPDAELRSAHPDWILDSCASISVHSKPSHLVLDLTANQ
jgi:mannitol-1-/sugar-/sorbitol-6-phosphatase